MLETRLVGGGGEARVLDCFAINVEDERTPRAELLRVVVGEPRCVDLEIVPRFDYGELPPWCGITISVPSA